MVKLSAILQKSLDSSPSHVELKGTLVSGIGVPLTGLSTTSAVGSPSFIFSIDLTLTGVQATTELNDYLILQYYGKLTPKDSTGYTTKTPKNSTGYTVKTA